GPSPRPFAKKLTKSRVCWDRQTPWRHFVDIEAKRLTPAADASSLFRAGKPVDGIANAVKPR
ncbi:MAG: hypothetical protein OXF07_02945, partial [Rhodobacter sp.]|nr:hypothetical protein [Rhodobacter sp.]